MSFFIPVVSAIVALAALAWNVYWSMRTSRQQSAQLIAAHRVNWIESLREEISQIVSICATVATIDDGSDNHTKRLSRLNIHAHKALLHLNQSDANQEQLSQNLYDLLKKINSAAPEDAGILTGKVMDESRALFKAEWERIKLEIGSAW